MKKLILIIPLFVLLACSVQKRRYQKGFYVNSSFPSQKSEVKSQKLKVEGRERETEETIFASADKVAEILKPEPKKYLQGETDSCDVILFKDGKEISAKIMEITPTEIKYKRCDMPSGPMYVVRKSEIFMLKYANGTSEIFKTETPSYNNNSYKNSDDDYGNKNSNYRPASRAKKEMYFLAVPSLLAGIASFVSFYCSLMFLDVVGSGYASLGVFGAFGVILGIGAIVMASDTNRNVKAMPEKYRGRGPSTVGIIFGIIGLALGALILSIFLLLI